MNNQEVKAVVTAAIGDAPRWGAKVSAWTQATVTA